MFIEPRGQHHKDKKIIVLMIEGGIGDHLLATPLIRAVRTTFNPKDYYFVLMAMYYEVFGYKDNTGYHPTNPNIDVLYSMRDPQNFYTEWARNADTIYRVNPYVVSPHRLGSKHLAEAWCDVHGFSLDELKIDFYPTEEETHQVEALFSTFENPVIAIQPFGSYDPIEHIKTTTNKDWYNDRWQFVISWLRNRGYDVLQIGKIGEHIFDNVFSLVGHSNIREAMLLMKYVNFFISIDSFAMHAAKVFGTLGVILWGRTNPFRVGYPENYNLYKLHSCPEIFCGRPEGILFDINQNDIQFTPWKCPHKNCMDSITVSDVCKGIGHIENIIQIDPAAYTRELTPRVQIG
jgi:ADP-heptose:LPS heptosyltransferase